MADVDVSVHLIDGTGDCVVEVVDGGRSWSSAFDVLSGDVDDLVEDLESRMNKQVEGESPLAVLVNRRVAEARARLRRDVVTIELPGR